MSYRLDIRPEALADIAETAAWYEERESGLGERFTREVIATIDALPINPLIYRVRHRRFGARWCFPRNFPYKVVYRVAGDLITIAGVIHASREECHWMERFENP
jgi:plasmid stabilization system protein ParE